MAHTTRMLLRQFVFLAVLVGHLFPVQGASAIYLGTETGPYKSTDNGASFVSLAAKIGTNPHPLLRGIPEIYAIAIDPKDVSIVYMVSYWRSETDVTNGVAALLKTVNGGETWGVVLLPNLGPYLIETRILIDLIATNVLYIQEAQSRAGLRSLDSGATWSPITVIPGVSAGQQFADLAIDPRNTRVLYARMRGGSAVEEQVFKSVDFGSTWVAVGKAAGTNRGHIYVDPRNSRHLILTTVGVCANGAPGCGPFRSTDGGVTWTNQELRTSFGIYTNFDAVVYDPRTDRLYMSANLSGLGMVIMSSPDGGTWTPVSNDPRFDAELTTAAPLAADSLDGLALYSYSNNDRVNFTPETNRILKSTDDGRSWTAHPNLSRVCERNAANCAFGGRGRLQPLIRSMAISPARPDELLNVSAASLLGGALAPDSIASAFGPRLSLESHSAANPTSSLGGVSVSISDSTGTTRTAGILSVSPTQVNYVIPPEVALGPATIAVNRSTGAPLRQKVQIVKNAPGLFSFDGYLAAAAVVRVSGQNVTYEPVFQVGADGKIAPRPISVVSATDQIFLVFYGTGLRRASTSVLAVNGVDAPLVYAGSQNEFAGLDQANIYIPPQFAGAGTVFFSLKAEGQPSNPVYVVFQ